LKHLRSQRIQSSRSKLPLHSLTEELAQYVPTNEISKEDEVGLQMELSIGGLKGRAVPYATRSKHGRHLNDHMPCYVRRSAAGYIIAYVSTRYASNVGNAQTRAPFHYIKLTFSGAWYLKGYENKERINKVYKKRGLKRPTGCRPF
jgi:hypothetical protein